MQQCLSFVCFLILAFLGKGVSCFFAENFFFSLVSLCSYIHFCSQSQFAFLSVVVPEFDLIATNNNLQM